MFFFQSGTLMRFYQFEMFKFANICHFYSNESVIIEKLAGSFFVSIYSLYVPSVSYTNVCRFFFSLLLLLFFVVLDWFNSILNTRHQHIYVKCCKSVVSCTYDLIWKHQNRLSQLKIHFSFSPYRRNTIKMYN